MRDKPSAHNQFSVQRNPQSRQKPRKWEKLRDFYSHFFLGRNSCLFFKSFRHTLCPPQQPHDLNNYSLCRGACELTIFADSTFHRKRKRSRLSHTTNRRPKIPMPSSLDNSFRSDLIEFYVTFILIDSSDTSTGFSLFIITSPAGSENQSVIDCGSKIYRCCNKIAKFDSPHTRKTCSLN